MTAFISERVRSRNRGPAQGPETRESKQVMAAPAMTALMTSMATLMAVSVTTTVMTVVMSNKRWLQPLSAPWVMTISVIGADYIVTDDHISDGRIYSRQVSGPEALQEQHPFGRPGGITLTNVPLRRVSVCCLKLLD